MGFIGFDKADTWTAALVGSHSHEMAVSSIVGDHPDGHSVWVQGPYRGQPDRRTDRHRCGQPGRGRILRDVSLLGAFTTVTLPAGFLTDGLVFANGSIPPDVSSAASW